MSRPPQSQPLFSIALIVRNEAHNLPRLLRSLTKFQKRGGEIVIVDTGSSDSTIDIARAAGCRVEGVGGLFTHSIAKAQANEINARFLVEDDKPIAEAGQPVFHFANARNYSATLATNDFANHITASDTFERFDIDDINALITEGKTTSFIYRKGVRYNKKRYATGSQLVNWFYNRTYYHWEGHIHETIYLNPSLQGMSERVTTLTTEELSMFHHRDLKRNRAQNMTGLALDILAGQNVARNKFHLGFELLNFQRVASALKILDECVTDDSIPADWRATGWHVLGRTYNSLGKRAQAADALQKSYDLDPARRSALLDLAELYSTQSNFQGCIILANIALTIPRTSNWGEDEIEYTWRPHALLYWALFWSGRKDEARMHWERCIELAPHNPRFRKHAILFGNDQLT